ncbi:MAG: hypothetical protein WD468_10425 [Pirellulales bacterium]
MRSAFTNCSSARRALADARYAFWWLAIVLLIGSLHRSPTYAATILRTDRVWNAAAHNAFTDLVWYDGRFVLAFREGTVHGVPPVSQPGGFLRVLQSSDGLSWNSAALIQGTSNEDLRDAKLSVTPDNRLMLTGAAAFKNATSERQSKVWFSNDATNWTAPVNIGDYNYWLWGTTWHNGQVYGVGYGPTNTSVADRDKRVTRLYRGSDGTDFNALVSPLAANSGLTGSGETALLFRTDGTAVVLSRRDSGNFESLIGTSNGDYTQWNWHVVPERTGGPELIELPDGRIVAASRRFVGKQTTTALFWLDPAAGTLTHFLTLPAGGDTSYAGMVWRNDLLWVSYYSSHEGKASIYVSQIQIPLEPPQLDSDYNSSRKVDAADYVMWRKSTGDGAGHELWRSNFGADLTASGKVIAADLGPAPLGFLPWIVLSAWNGSLHQYLQGTWKSSG